MSVSLDDLKEQLRVDGTDDDTSLQAYLDASKSWIQNAVTSDSADDLFFSELNVQPLSDIAVVSLAMEMWANRSLSMPLSTVTDMMIGQMRGLYSAWKEAQEALIEPTDSV